MNRLSVALIVKNEARHIQACLASVSFADEIVVLDSGSSDDTRDLAAAMGAVVNQNADWQGFGVQKNRALDLTTSEWVLSLDADELVSEELKREILAVLAQPAFDAYSMPRLSSFCGQYMHHSGWYPDRVTRLFRRGTARFSNDLVHERLVPSGPVGQLRSPLLHETMTDLEATLDKLNRYSTAGAAGYAARGKRGSLSSAVGHGLWAFFRTYVLRRGFLDGRMGFILAVSNAESSYYRYLKLWLLQRDGP